MAGVGAAALLALAPSSAPGFSPLNPPAGGVDAAYGTQGVWSSTFPTPQCPGLAEANGIASQSSGAAFVVGDASQQQTAPCPASPPTDFVVAKLTTAGVLAGWTHTHFTGSISSRANAVAVQSDGKAVVVGAAVYDNAGTSSLAIARYTSAGVLDSAFGAGCNGTNAAGTTTVRVPGLSESATAVALDSSGKIVVVGRASSPATHADFVVVRLTTAGCLDATFGGGDGVVVQDFPAHGDDRAVGVAIQSDGSIVVGGTVSGGSADELGLARFTPTGALDTTYGHSGFATADFGSGTTAAMTALVMQGSGKVVAVGSTCVTTCAQHDFAVARFTTAGALDPSFAGDGRATLDFAGDDVARAVTNQANRLIVVGQSQTAGGSELALARLTGAGSLEQTFGNGGSTLIDVSALDGHGAGHGAVAAAVVQGATGRLLVAGSETLSHDTAMAVTRVFLSSPPAPDGSGTISVTPSQVSPGSSGNTLVFRYEAAGGGLTAGKLTLTVPAGWSAPTTTTSAPGYTTATAGTVAVSGRTITLSSLTLAGGDTVSITYAGASAPATPAVQTWQVQEQSSATGAFAPLAAGSPSTTVVGGSGLGSMGVAPGAVGAGATGVTLTFTYTAAAPIADGALVLTVPPGWSPPSALGTSAGYLTASAGRPRILGRTLLLTGLRLDAGDSVTIVYGSKIAGGPGAGAPSTAVGAQTWSTAERSTPSDASQPLAAQPVVTVGE